MSFNIVACLERYAEIAAALGASVTGSSRAAAASAIQTVQELLQDLGVARRLSDLGVPQEVLPMLAEFASRDVCLYTNPRDATVEDLQRIYLTAW